MRTGHLPVVERLLEDLLVDPHLPRDFPQRPAGLVCRLDDLGAPVVADVGIECRGRRQGGLRGTRTLSSNCPCEPATVIAPSLPITCAPTWITTSQITGLTLPGMIEEPF